MIQTINLKMRRRTPPQRRICESNKRFNVACWGRQSGKTTFGIDKKIWKPLQGRPNAVYWYVLQTYSAAEIAFKRHAFLLEKSSLIEGKNKSDLSLTLLGNRTVHFKSGKNFEDLRAETLDGAIIDEVRQQHADLWPMVIRPMLAKRKGWCDFLSTSNGFDHFKDLFDFAIEHPKDWSSFHAPSTEAWWWTEEEIASARATMSEDVFAQEIMAEFREMGAGKVYKNHGTWNHKTENPFAVRGYEWSHYLPIIVGLDFNVGMMVWVLGQRRGHQMHFQQEICVENTDSQQCATILAERVKDHKPGVILVGDASGNARKTSAVGETDYKLIKAMLKSYNIKYEDLTPKENPFVKDRINCVNSALKAADGTVNLTYNPIKMPNVRRDFERVKWKQGADGAFLDKSDAKLTHSSDALGYPVCHYMDIFRERPGILHVIPR